MFTTVTKTIKRLLNRDKIKDLKSQKNGLKMRLEGMQGKLASDEELLSSVRANLRVGPAVTAEELKKSLAYYQNEVDMDNAEIDKLIQEIKLVEEALSEFE